MEESKLTYVPPEVIVPEVTLKGTLLAIVLTVVMTASAVYLGLKVGLTISASIPAAVISMGLLGMFKHSNILENNLVQTAASGGMSLASGIIFCLPALVIMGVWDNFHYWESFTITLYGGLLGVLFSIPFRKVLLNEPTLHYPEGMAITHVLQAKASGSQGLKRLLIGGIVGAFIALAQMGLKVVSETVNFWWKIGSTVGGFGLGFSPVLLGAGFIIGPRVALVAFAGCLLGWAIGIPILGGWYGVPEGNATEAAWSLWSTQVRYIGVGVLLFGGLWTFTSLIKPLLKGLRVTARANVGSVTLRTDREMSLTWVILLSLTIAVPIYIAYQGTIAAGDFGLPMLTTLGLDLTLVVYTLIAGLFFSVVCGYIVGMVGSSASPLSALALGAIILVCLIILGFLGGFGMFEQNPEKALAAGTLAITVGVIIICATAITNDTIQDLKVGQMVGATPYKQQLMQMMGVLIAALIVPPILDLLFKAYGIADVLPRENMNPQEALAAPQAQLMASIAKGVFQRNIPWMMISIGGVLAVITIGLDALSRKKGYGSIPVIALGLGIYLPISASTPLILGGLVSGLGVLAYRKKNKTSENLKNTEQKVFIMASGLIAGGALVGIALAVPFVIYQSTDAFTLVGPEFLTLAHGLGFLTTFLVCYWAYRLLTKDSIS